MQTSIRFSLCLHTERIYFLIHSKIKSSYIRGGKSCETKSANDIIISHEGVQRHYMNAKRLFSPHFNQMKHFQLSTRNLLLPWQKFKWVICTKQGSDVSVPSVLHKGILVNSLNGIPIGCLVH